MRKSSAYRHTTSLLLAAALLAGAVVALQNGAALTPPKGWLSWMRYGCTTACSNATAAECFNEGLIRQTADAMVELGYKDAGYDYVALDDCWQAPHRVNGHVVADPHRFPSGIQALAEYVHAKGLKLGLYTAVGPGTCAMGGTELGLGCEGDALQSGCAVARRDLEDFVGWGIDMLKVDGCSPIHSSLNASYATIGALLQNATARRQHAAGGVAQPVVYNPSCLSFNFPRQFRELAAIGNMWRFTHDNVGTWASVASIIDNLGAGMPACVPGPLPPNCTGWHYSAEGTVPCEAHCTERDKLLSVPGPGNWLDLDQLVVGNTPCSDAARASGMHCAPLSADEEATQMAMWAMASAPLFMSNDLPQVPATSRALLQNHEVLAVQGDALGRMAFRFFLNSTSGAQGWKKELLGGTVAVALLNMGDVPPAPAPGPCLWNRTTGGYREACGGASGNLWCGEFGSLQAAKDRCCANAACTGFSVATVATPSGPAWHGCEKQGGACGIKLNSAFDGYEKLPPPATATVAAPVASGLRIGFDFRDVGFAPDTRVRVRDLIKGEDLGVFAGRFEPAAAVRPHGVLMLKLTYEPEYNADL